MKNLSLDRRRVVRQYRTRRSEVAKYWARVDQFDSDNLRTSWTITADLSSLCPRDRSRLAKAGRINAKAKGTRNEKRSIAPLEALGYAYTSATVSLGIWDIIRIGSTDVVRGQLNTRDWPGVPEVPRLIPTPANCARLAIHRLRIRQCPPDVREVVHA